MIPPLRDTCSVASLLPLDSFDPAGNVFVQRDGSIGLAWSIEQVESELASEEALGTLASRIDSLVRSVPTGAACQIILETDRNVRERTDVWARATVRDGIYRDLANARVESIRNSAIMHEGRLFVARTFRLTLTVRIFPAWKSPGFVKTVSSALKGTNAVLEHFRSGYEREKERLLDTANAVESVLTQAGIPYRRLAADDVVLLSYRLLNPTRSRSTPPPPDDGRVLRDRIAFSPIQFDFNEGVFTINGYAHAVYSAADTPRETWAGMLTRRDGGRPPILDLIPESVLVFNIEIPDPEAIRKFLAAKKRLAFCQLASGDARVDVSAIREETNQAIAEMYVNGGRVVSSRMHVIIREASRSALKERGAAVVSALASIGITAVDDSQLSLSLFLQSLPLGYDYENDRALKRGRKMFGQSLAHLTPLPGSFRGTRTPDLILQNRSGEVVFFSPFDSDVAPHLLVTGTSGSGKSYTANTLIVCAARRGAHIFVLDRGNSYRKLARILGGTYVTFDPNNPISLNPCGRDLDNKKTIFLSDIVIQMCTQGTRELAVNEKALIEKAIPTAFERKHGQEVLLSDIQAVLREFGKQDRAAHVLATCLEMFCGNGPFAGFFDRPCAVDFENPLTVFELGDMAKRKDVGPVILMALIHNITEFSAKHRDIPKYLMVDEAWTLLKSENTAAFLEEVLRTYRKLNASAVLISQQATDFAGPIGHALRFQAVNRIFLMQTPDTIVALEQALGLSPEEKAILGCLSTVKGRFAEMLITSPGAKGVARLTADPLSYWVMTSDPVDNTYLDGLIRKYEEAGDPDALRSALREAAAAGRPGGQKEAA